MSLRIISCLILIFSILSTGCQNVTQLKDNLFEWGATEYELNMNRSDINTLEQSLAENIYPMDTQLTKMLRDLSVRDTFPSVQWMERMLTDFFWLNGITVMDKNRDIIAVYPETGIKQLNFDPVFPEAFELRQGRVMLAIEETPLGNEVLLVSSIFDNFELTGLIVVNFDPRTFISQSVNPEDIILISEDEVVWTGRFEHHAQTLAEVNWQEMLTRRISGKIQVNEDRFFWLARAVGEDWLIYLVKDK
ncbi:MAG: hypothetical protein D5R98_07530 [Desulfonatronovibrio sp. MSAO_Bac4]|nr:MAG: hypothetical protein D5R98_07530 [Desulfonatronovibrio sp. MSAO_Bac4]